MISLNSSIDLNSLVQIINCNDTSCSYQTTCETVTILSDKITNLITTSTTINNIQTANINNIDNEIITITNRVDRLSVLESCALPYIGFTICPFSIGNLTNISLLAHDSISGTDSSPMILNGNVALTP